MLELGNHRDRWSWAEMPVDGAPVPTWCTDAVIDWKEGYANVPRVILKTDCSARSWPDQAFVLEDADAGHYSAYHDDGRLEHWTAPGELTWSDDERAWLTPQGGGLGQRWMSIIMAEGGAFIGDRRRVILRGPWFNGSPEGYIEVSYVWPQASARAETRPWHRHTRMAGLRLKSDVVLAIVAHFEPSVRLALTDRYGAGPELELVRSDWAAPKNLRAEDRVDVHLIAAIEKELPA